MSQSRTLENLLNLRSWSDDLASEGFYFFPEHMLGSFLVIVIVSFFLYTQSRQLDSNLSRLLTYAILLKLVIALMNIWVVYLPLGSSDAATYERVAWHIAQRYSSDISFFNSFGSNSFEVMMGSVYKITGRNPLILVAINVSISQFVIYYAYLAALTCWHGDKTLALRVAWISGFFPMIIIVSVTPLREMFVIGPLTFAVYQFIRYAQHGKLARMFSGVAALFVAGAFHPAVLVSLPAVLAYTLIKRPEQTSTGIRLSPMLSRLSAFLLVVVTVLAVFALGLDDIFKYFDAERATARLTEREPKGGAAYPAWLRSDGLLTSILFAPILIVYFLLAPFPWDIRGVQHLIGVLVNIPILLILISILKSRRTIKGNNAAKMLFFLLMANIVIFGVSVDNFGTALRHKTKFIAIFAVLAVRPVVRFRHHPETMRQRIPST